MKLTVLGSGTSVPHPKRSSPAFWLETSAGTILLDCSASAVHRMAQENLDWANLDAIWISHFHLDHCGGLAPFLFGTKHAPETQPRTKPMRVFGAAGLRGLVQKFSEANSYDLFKQPFPLEIFEVERLEKFEILSGVEAVASSTLHTAESHAIHLRERETTFVYTSDTGYDPTLAALARRVDLLLMECSFVKAKPVKIHLELPEAIRLIRRAEPKRTILTHLYPQWDAVNFQQEVTKLLPGREVLEAVDGLRISFPE